MLKLNLDFIGFSFGSSFSYELWCIPADSLLRAALFNSLLQQNHLFALNELGGLQLVEIHPAAQLIRVEYDPVDSGTFVPVDKIGNFLTKDIVNLQADLAGLWKCVCDGRRRVKWIRIVLIQLVFPDDVLP